MFVDRICANHSPVNAYVLFDGSVKVEVENLAYVPFTPVFLLQYSTFPTATLVDLPPLWHLQLRKDQVLPFQPN